MFFIVIETCYFGYLDIKIKKSNARSIRYQTTFLSPRDSKSSDTMFFYNYNCHQICNNQCKNAILNPIWYFKIFHSLWCNKILIFNNKKIIENLYNFFYYMLNLHNFIQKMFIIKYRTFIFPIFLNFFYKCIIVHNIYVLYVSLTIIDEYFLLISNQNENFYKKKNYIKYLQLSYVSTFLEYVCTLL